MLMRKIDDQAVSGMARSVARSFKTCAQAFLFFFVVMGALGSL